MKRVLSVCVFIFVAGLVSAQDLVVTVGNDSLICQITKVDQDYIYLTLHQENASRSTIIPLSQIQSYSYNYFPEIKRQYSSSDDVVSVEKTSFPRFRVSLGGGLGYRLAFISSDITDDFMRNYVRKLKLGYQFHAVAAGYFNKFVGLGVKANLFRSSTKAENFAMQDNITGMRIYIAEMSDNTSTLFVAPVFSARFISRRNGNALVMNAGIGYMGYWDKTVLRASLPIIGGTTEIAGMTKGGTVGVSYDIGYDIRLNNFLLLGLQGSITTGTLYQVKDIYNNQTVTRQLEGNSAESLLRIDLSIGLQFSK